MRPVAVIVAAAYPAACLAAVALAWALDMRVDRWLVLREARSALRRHRPGRHDTG